MAVHPSILIRRGFRFPLPNTSRLLVSNSHPNNKCMEEARSNDTIYVTVFCVKFCHGNHIGQTYQFS